MPVPCVPCSALEAGQESSRPFAWLSVARQRNISGRLRKSNSAKATEQKRRGGGRRSPPAARPGRASSRAPRLSMPVPNNSIICCVSQKTTPRRVQGGHVAESGLQVCPSRCQGGRCKDRTGATQGLTRAAGRLNGHARCRPGCFGKPGPLQPPYHTHCPALMLGAWPSAGARPFALVDQRLD